MGRSCCLEQNPLSVRDAWDFTVAVNVRSPPIPAARVGTPHPDRGIFLPER